MSCPATARPHFSVETAEAIYRFQFAEVQFEITGRCNMRCDHCRGAFDLKQDLPLAAIEPALQFARRYSPDFKEVTISGGEPLLHRHFHDIVGLLRRHSVQNLTLTTNGSLLRREDLLRISEHGFKRVTVSVSVDSVHADVHDTFRHARGAHSAAVAAIAAVAAFQDQKFEPSLRASLTPSTLSEMEPLVKLAIRLGARRVSFSSILPSGRARSRTDLWFGADLLRQFSDELQRLALAYKGRIAVSSNEPLKWLSRGSLPTDETGILSLCCCPAGTISFNIASNGDMTPCSLIETPIMNVLGLSSDEIATRYKSSSLVHDLFDRRLSGKCGSCSYRKQCAGCRARALGTSGDLLGEDPWCWRNPTLHGAA